MGNEPNGSEVSATIHKNDGYRFKAIQTVGWAILPSLFLVEAKAPLFMNGLASYLQIREVIILHENCGEKQREIVAHKTSLRTRTQRRPGKYLVAK